MGICLRSELRWIKVFVMVSNKTHFRDIKVKVVSQELERVSLSELFLLPANCGI